MKPNYSFRNAVRGNPYTRGRMTDEMLRAFVIESNKIEGILREPNGLELGAHQFFLERNVITVADMSMFVRNVAGVQLRTERGMDVRVGDHRPPPGGPQILLDLGALLTRANSAAHGMAKPEVTPYSIHVEYETLHPFMDGNGRSGRALWLWMMKRNKDRMLELGFLHAFYYQALSASRR